MMHCRVLPKMVPEPSLNSDISRCEHRIRAAHVPIVPLITSKPASFPVSSAQNASRFVVVGSSCMTSSSSVVAEMASSILVVGVVTVSPILT